MTSRSNTAEGQSSGTVLSVANSGGGSGDAFNTYTVTASGQITYSNAQSAHGSQSYYTNVNAQQAWVAWTGLNGSSAAIRVYVRLVSAPSNVFDFAMIRSGSSVIKLQILAARTLRVVNLAGTTVKTFAALTTGVWYRIDLYVAKGASNVTGTIKCAYYLHDDAAPVEAEYSSTTTDAGTANFDAARVGQQTGAGTTEYYFDDFAFSDTAVTYLGPVVTSVSLNDTGAGTDAVTVAAAATLADTGTGTDTLSTAVATTLADTGTATDAIATAVALTAADTAAAADTLTVAATTILTDTATGADAFSVTVAVDLADTTTAADTFGADVAVPLAEVALGTDAISVAGSSNPSLPDVAVGTDAITTAATVPLDDTALGTDAFAVDVAAAFDDIVAASDLFSVAALVALDDTATATDAVLVSGSGTGSRNVTVTIGSPTSRLARIGAPTSRARRIPNPTE